MCLNSVCLFQKKHLRILGIDGNGINIAVAGLYELFGTRGDHRSVIHVLTVVLVPDMMKPNIAKIGDNEY